MNFIKSSLVLGGVVLALTITDCPGYVATNVETTDNSISAALILRDEACNIYGGDLINLSLMVEYQSGKVLDSEIAANGTLIFPLISNSTSCEDL